MQTYHSQQCHCFGITSSLGLPKLSYTVPCIVSPVAIDTDCSLLCTVRLIAPGFSHSEQCLPTCVEETSEYAYVQLDLPTPVQPRGPPPSSPPPPPPQHAKQKHRMSLPLQPSQVPPRPQQPDTIDEGAYEEMEVPDGDKSLRQEKVQVPVNWNLSQPQPSRPSPPASPACLDLSTKPKPKKVPSTGVPVIPAVSPRTLRPPPVSKKPITPGEQYLQKNYVLVHKAHALLEYIGL